MEGRNEGRSDGGKRETFVGKMGQVYKRKERETLRQREKQLLPSAA